MGFHAMILFIHGAFAALLTRSLMNHQPIFVSTCCLGLIRQKLSQFLCKHRIKQMLLSCVCRWPGVPKNYRSSCSKSGSKYDFDLVSALESYCCAAEGCPCHARCSFAFLVD